MKKSTLIFPQHLFMRQIKLRLLYSILCLCMWFASEAQQQCETSIANPNTPAPNSFTENAAGPFYVKVYFYTVNYILNPSIPRLTLEQVKESYNVLSKDFAPHNIFFVWDCSVDEITDPGVVGSVFDNNQADGINIYLYPAELPGSGLAADYISKAFAVYGLGLVPPYNPLYNSHLMSHEMGHCLGLYHTFDNFAFGAELVNGSNGATAGDRMTDTPADPNLSLCVDAPPSCEWTGERSGFLCVPFGPNNPKPVDANGDEYNPSLINYMSYTHYDCMAEFTPNQAQYMRNILATLLSDVTTTIPSTSSLPTHIYQTTTYSTPVDASGDIIVHSGAQLTVNNVLNMPAAAQIIVERNARLVVGSAGVITKGCGAPFWQGIQVLGNASLAQPLPDAPLTNSNQAGIVKVSGTIEWAKCGISTAGGYPSQYWGGVVYTNGAKFLNNRKDAEFMSYSDKNRSKFINTLFTEDCPAFTNTEGVTMWETKGISFDKCRFINKDLEAIRTYDASISVFNESSFEGNETGISAYATYPMTNSTTIGSGVAVENTFKSNKYHINASLATGLFGLYNNGGFSLNIINNNFENGEYGVIIDGSSKYTVAGNKFSTVPYGVWSANSAYNNPLANNIVQCNTFTGGNKVGILAIGNNSKMSFLGNNFKMAGGSTDFALTGSLFPFVNGSVFSTQGNYVQPADNCFTNPNSQDDILTFGANTDKFTYYYKLIEPGTVCEPEPFTVGNYDKELALEKPSIDCSKYGGLPLGLEPPTLTDLLIKQSELEQLFPNIDNNEQLQLEYDQLLQEKEAILNYLLRQSLEVQDYSTAESILASEHNKASNWAIFGLRMDQKNYSSAAQWLNQLPIEDAEDTRFREIQLINLQRLQAPASFQLNKEQENYLQSVAESASPIRGYARGILGLLKNRRYYPEVFDLTKPSIPTERTQRTAPNTSNHLALSPVPAQGTLWAAWPELPTDDAAQLRIYDLLGTTSINVPIAPLQTQKEIDISQLPNGIYFLVIISQGKIQHRAKFTVQH